MQNTDVPATSPPTVGPTPTPRPYDGQPTMRVYSASSRRWFTVRYLKAGEKAYPGDRFADQAQVEFYDATFAADTRFADSLGLGQFTGARYYVSTLFEDAMQAEVRGLSLNGSIAEWRVSPAAMRLVMQWLDNVGQVS